MTIAAILQALVSLLYAPNPNHPSESECATKDASLVPEIAEQCAKDPDAFEKSARIWTKRYAA